LLSSSSSSRRMSTYSTFVKFGGVAVFCVVIFCQLASQVLSIEANFWLSDWGKETTIDQYVHGTDMSKQRAFHWFRGYAGMQMASIFFMFSSRMMLNYHRTNCSREFHKRLVQTVLFLPVSFFDVTPMGRVLNRFSQVIFCILFSCSVQVIW
jgi:ATP-binding cassette, subfamily C (CFTR/MRP), member 1